MSVESFKFDKTFVGKSAGDFKMKLKERYPKLSKKDVDALVEREFPDEFQKDTDGKSSRVQKQSGESQ